MKIFYAMIFFLFFLYGCNTVTSNSVLYQITTMQRTLTYSWSSSGEERHPISYKDWLGSIRYPSEDKVKSKIKTEEL